MTLQFDENSDWVVLSNKMVVFVTIVYVDLILTSDYSNQSQVFSVEPFVFQYGAKLNLHFVFFASFELTIVALADNLPCRQGSSQLMTVS